MSDAKRMMTPHELAAYLDQTLAKMNPRLGAVADSTSGVISILFDNDPWETLGRDEARAYIAGARALAMAQANDTHDGIDRRMVFDKNGYLGRSENL